MMKKLAMLCSVSMLLALPGCCGWKWCGKKKCVDYEEYEGEYEHDDGSTRKHKTKYVRENGGRRRMKTEVETKEY